MNLWEKLTNTKKPRGEARGRRVDELHRPPTRVERFRAWLENLPRLRLYVLVIITTWFLLTLLISLDSRPFIGGSDRQAGGGYKVGNVASEDIYASRTVTYRDPVATEEARREAAEQIPRSFRQDSAVPEQVLGAVPGFFEQVRGIRASDAPPDTKASQVRNAATYYLPDKTVRSLLFVDDEQLDTTERYVLENLTELYDSTAVADSNVQETPAAVISLSEGRSRLSDAAQADASGEVQSLIAALSRGFLQPNYVVNGPGTQEARDRAASAVQPVAKSVQQGELVVARGEVVDQEDVAQLDALGLSGSENRWMLILGVGLVVAAEMGIAWYFLERFGRRILRTKALIRILLAASLTVLFTALARAFVLLSINPYLIPLAGLGILGTILLGPRLMFLMIVISSVNVGIIGGNDFFLASALLISSGFAIYTAVRVGSRTELLWAGLLIALVTSIVTFAFSMISGGGFAVALQQGGWGLANGALSLMIAMVLLPLLENAFNLLTPMKLLELSDPGRPLLMKLLRRAPGTFSHSMQVGNLAENAAERIGADPLLARVAAYYHDIGKLEHPGYFIENQISRMNPHNALSPALSARVIRRHVKDGLDIGRAWNLPQEILDIIGEHHGTTRIEYFYRKAIEESLDGEVPEADFRYYKLPRSKEAGIMMLADSVEATVKSIDKPTPKRIEDVVASNIHAKLDDGQFDNCELTMREIHEVGEAIREALIGFLGPRIEYPQAPSSSEAPGAKTRTAT